MQWWGQGAVRARPCSPAGFQVCSPSYGSAIRPWERLNLGDSVTPSVKRQGQGELHGPETPLQDCVSADTLHILEDLAWPSAAASTCLVFSCTYTSM